MNAEQVKGVLASIGYPANGEDLTSVLDDLHENYSPQVIGSSVRQLGDAEPLYVKAGQVAFLIDNEQDLVSACIRIRAFQKKREADKPVNIVRERRSRWLGDIIRAVEYEIETAERIKRPLAVVDDQYQISFDPDSRTQTRKGQKIIDDLLSTDAALNQKAVQALQAILICERQG